jgi:hypothetical protein
MNTQGAQPPIVVFAGGLGGVATRPEEQLSDV